MNVVPKGFSRYLPVNEKDLLWEIYCNDAGYSQVPPGASYPPLPESHPKAYASDVATGRILREYQVVYISAGKGWLEEPEGRKWPIAAGDVFIIFPGIRHAYRPDPETGWHEYWVGFAGKHASRLHRNGLLSEDKPVHHVGPDQDIMGDFEQIIHLCRQQGPGYQMLLGSLILRLLAHMHAADMRSRITHGEGGLVEMARSVMLLHLEDGIEVRAIADETGVAYTELLNVFRKQTGLTPYAYFLQLRIHRAKELLENPALSVKEIAARMNFDNQYYFSRIFKKKTGLSPSRWRSAAIPEVRR